MLAVAAVAALLGLVVGLAAYLFLQQKQAAAGSGGGQHRAADAAAAAGRGGGRAAGGGGGAAGNRRQLRQRRQQAAAAAAARHAGDSDDDDEASGSGSEDGEPLNRREQARADRAEARAAEAAQRAAKADKISAYNERRAAKEAEREAKEKAKEEEARRAAEEKQKAEDEEAAKWMNMISVEDTGTLEEQAAGEDSGLLGRFIDYIIARKMVPIEEAATEFGLRSSEVVDRIQGLEAMGRISGVMDERGKFIFISRGEMEAVAAHIRTKGRVSIAALAAASNNLIDLEAKSAVEVVGAGGGGGGGGPVIDFDSLAGGDGGEEAQ